VSGGVNPLEWLVPPVAVSHLIVDQGARVAGQRLPPAPGSETAKDEAARAAAERARATLLAEADAARTQADADLAARTETPQEALDAKRRATLVAQRLGGGHRRASQTLTETGMTLSGSY
jgi:hypothetical protein